MDLDYLGLVFRWLHILPAMAAVGGTIFMRLALLPSVGVLPDESRNALHAAVRSRWSKVVMISIALLLISGFYNFLMIVKHDKIPEDAKGLYHGLFGLKFLLALAIFFIASALVGRSQAFENLRRNARFWLTLNLVLAIVLVCVSGGLRLLRDVEAQAGDTEPVIAAAATTDHFDRA